MMSGHFVWLWVDTSASMSIHKSIPIPVHNASTSTASATAAASATFPPPTEQLINQILSRLKSRTSANKRRDRRDTSNKPMEGPARTSHVWSRVDKVLSERDMTSIRNTFTRASQQGAAVIRDLVQDPEDEEDDSLPIGLLALRTQPMKVDRQVVKGTVRLLADTLHRVLTQCTDWTTPTPPQVNTSCWSKPSPQYRDFATLFVRELRVGVMDVLAGRRGTDDKALVASFDILNLVPEKSTADYDSTPTTTTTTTNNPATGESEGKSVRLCYTTAARDESVAVAWKPVGEVTGRAVRLDTIVWPGGDLVVAGLSARARSVFRIVTALAPPFVMEGELDEDGQCLRGLPCHRVLTSDKDNLTLVFNEMETHERLEDEEEELEEDMVTQHAVPLSATSSTFEMPNHGQRYKYRTNCCYGLAMDLLENVAQELEFDFHLYIAADGLFGTKTRAAAGGIDRHGDKWNGIVGDLVSGAAHMSFAALSVSSSRSEVIDFSVPYFFSGVSFLAAPTQKSEIPLLAFLLPFSPELWIAIFTSLNITAMAVAVYEWLSPFGLNPWGRQRSKNFRQDTLFYLFKLKHSSSIASALWVMWGLLCGHLVAFKAPKSWPNKFLINVWGGFSVIFVASYTANIAALIAGLFFHNAVSNYHDRSVGKLNKYCAVSASESTRGGSQGLCCRLLCASSKPASLGTYAEVHSTERGGRDTVSQDSISAVIAKYSSNGYMDILQEKWYGALPCFKLATDMAQPRPLGVAAVAGVFILLGLGMVLGCLILLFEHLFYRYTLPILRHQPKGTIWRSRNIMFFSQKLYRFINCVELVSPHHAARELVHTIRQGQITSLFQKSVKRHIHQWALFQKEHEQRRRRKSKAQFFEMIQEIRRVQQEGRDQPTIPEEVQVPKSGRRVSKDLLSPLVPSKSSPRRLIKSKSPRAIEARKFCKEIFSPGGSRKVKVKSPLNRRRFSTDMIFSPLRSRLECPSNAVGRRLSKDSNGNNSPPDINSRRCSNLDVSSKQDKLSSLDLRFHQGKSNLDVRLPDTRASGSNLHMMPRMGSTGKHGFGARRPEVSSVQERLNTIGSRLGSLSSTDIDNGSLRITRSRSRSPIPSMLNVNFPSPTEKATTMPKYRDRVRSDTNAREALQSRPRLRTPSPTEVQVAVDLNSNAGRSRSLENNRSVSQEDEIKPAPIPEPAPQPHPKLKRSDFTLPYESIIEVNVTCCDTPEKTPRNVVVSSSQEQINASGSSPSPYSSLKKAQFKRRQSHQPRLETVYTPQHKLVSPTSSSQSSTKEFLVPVQRHENSSSSSSSRSPVRRRHQSHPAPQDKTAIPSSSSIPDVSSSPHRQRHYHHRRHRSRDSSHECDEVFDDIPPPPPPPFCPPRNGSNGESPLDRLNKEELVALWRSSESELRSHLLRAIRAKEVTDPP
ncbi:hypothetical protein C0J52_03006 [Blattella germanica]|nr:hypothetical protein C0J52_03006 [Blattella germanica]